MIHPGLTYADYAAIDAINWSRLKALRVSPLQFLHELTNPPSFDAAHFRIGTATHCRVLEPQEFDSRYVLFKGTRRGKAWDAAKAHAEAARVTVLNEDEAQAALGAAAAVVTNPHAASILSAGLREVSITWEDEVTHFDCKGRIDFAGDHMVDLKTAARIDPRSFAAQAARLGYHAQFAFYLDGLRANGLASDKPPVLIAVQSSMPHDVIVYLMPPHVIEAGRREYRRLLAKLYDCTEADRWPGVAPNGPVVFELPKWAYDDTYTLEDAAADLEETT